MQKTQKKNMFTTILGYLFVAFIGAALSYFVWPELMKSIDVRLFGIAEVVVNINELQMLHENQRLEDFSILFGTSNNTGWVAAIKVGHKELNKLFGETLIPSDFGEFSNLEYNITIANLGKRTAKNFELSFDGAGLETNQERDATPNINFLDCRGFGEQQSCVTKIKSLRKGERAGFFARAAASSVRNISCKMESVGGCSINLRNFYVKKVTEKEQLGIKLDGAVIQPIPPLNESSTPVFFRYKPQDDKWIPMDKQSLQFILRKEGLSFDISSIPEGATIDSYTINYDNSFGQKVIVEHSE